MEHEELVGHIRAATHHVFGTMLSLKLADADACVRNSCSTSNGDVMALIGLAGAWAGTGTFSCSSETARRVSGAFLMQEFASVDEEVLDAICEIANMILGNVKSELEEELGPMGLSIPTAIFGHNFTTRSVSGSDWSEVPFKLDDQLVSIHVCLAPRRRATRPQPAAIAISQ